MSRKLERERRQQIKKVLLLFHLSGAVHSANEEHVHAVNRPHDDQDQDEAVIEPAGSLNGHSHSDYW